MPVEENRWRYSVTAELISLGSVEWRSAPKLSCNGGPMKRANSESEGQLRPRPSSAYFRHATIPLRGSVNVPSRSKRTFTIVAVTNQDTRECITAQMPTVHRFMRSKLLRDC